MLSLCLLYGLISFRNCGKSHNKSKPRSPRRLPSSHLLGLISGGFTLDKTHHIRSHLFRVDDEDNYHHHHHYHLIVSKSKDNGVEDGLENDQRVGECVQKKTEHWVHVTVAELAALETIIIVVAVVIIINIIIKYDIIIRFIIKSDTF